MPTQNPVNWFEVPTSDLVRATAFYEGVFQVKLSQQDLGGLKMAWFPMVEGGGGSSGTLIQSVHYTPSHAGSLVYFATENMEATLERIERYGGTVLRGKTNIGEFGFVAHFEDSEGNRLALRSDR